MAHQNGASDHTSLVFRGMFIHATQKEAVQVMEDALLGVDAGGKISFIGEGKELDRLSETFGFSPSAVIQLKQHEFFMPGMVDTHIHASQYSYAGTALDMPLLDWLKNYTFPVESEFKDLTFAQKVYTQVVRRTLRNGTTTACYFATIYTDSSLLLGHIANDLGQRALVGKVCMDQNNSVNYYKESLQESLEETRRFISQLLAKKSHISENVEEVKIVKELFPDCDSYTDVYYKHNLLTNKTVMAHGCYLSDEELALFRETGASLSHCPNSNISLCSGMLDVCKVLRHKVKLGLGTDVAGGYSASMLDAMRRAMDTSKILTIQDPKHETLNFEEVFRLATLGGSQALSLDDQIGNFEVGKDFDALRVNVAVPDGPIDVIQHEKPKIILEKFLNLGDDRNIVEVYVAGKKVVPLPV
uniref:guanine deaminase isoform X2 n=1 Tax=Doryrhamphus excisus TaxID=161450 RepID=UPI0025ADC514|nr:guanine deaminase isoform X2 [Doryrhamphus excisus]